MKRALVLSGGGSKGSYEVGVWKALRRLNVKYDIITGTSIGALNGALMTQNSYLRTLYIWHKLNLEYLFNQSPKSNENVDVLKLFGDNFLKNGGMDIKKIEDIISKSIKKKKFFKSKIDYGLITYNFTTKKPMSLAKKDIDPDKLVDYLMASATCFPAFQMKDIDGDKFIDGGFYDNLPINLAVDLGADELIVVDLNAPGLKRKMKRKEPMIYITPRNTISFFLNFNRKEAKMNMRFGYNDTMKAFNKLDGNYFTFKKNSIDKYYGKHQSKLDAIVHLKKSNFLELLEDLGKNFELREDKIYSVRKFIKELKKEVDIQEEISKELMKQITSKKIKEITNTKAITLYFLSNIEKKVKEPKALTTIFLKHYQQALFLNHIGAYYGK